MLRRRLYEEVRYEVERWPLWRLDRNLRYLAKHLLHRQRPASAEDAAFWAAQAAWLGRLRAELPDAGGVRLVAGGDLMWLRAGWDDFLSPGLGAALAAADAVLANLETPVEPRRPVRRYTYETLRYNAPPAYLDAWARAAPRSVLSLCNNHALDQGLGGLRATRAAVGARGIVCLGGPDAETEAVALLEVGGLRLARVGLTFGINGLARGTAGPPGVPVLEFGDPRARTELDALPARMAAEVAALLPGATLAGYKEFLDTMYHYTLRSEERLRAAAGAADEPALQGFLTALAHDEARHYLLAEADLRALGSSPRADRPASVQSFEAAWSALPTAHAAAWTGALAVLEGVAAHLGAAALPALSRLGLGKAQARFVLVHLDAGAAHGSLCRQHALRLGKEYSALLLQGAHAAAVAWVDMHRCLAK